MFSGCFQGVFRVFSGCFQGVFRCPFEPSKGIFRLRNSRVRASRASNGGEHPRVALGQPDGLQLRVDAHPLAQTSREAADRPNTWVSPDRALFGNFTEAISPYYSLLVPALGLYSSLFSATLRYSLLLSAIKCD